MNPAYYKWLCITSYDTALVSLNIHSLALGFTEPGFINALDECDLYCKRRYYFINTQYLPLQFNIHAKQNAWNQI